MAVNREVYEMLLANRGIGDNLIATTDKGVVTLSGSVSTHAERKEIEDLVRAMAGVNTVTDDMTDQAATAHMTLENKH